MRHSPSIENPIGEAIDTLEAVQELVKAAISAYGHGRYATGDEKAERALRFLIVLAPDLARDIIEEG